MSVILQIRRDSAGNIGTQVGAQGELWMDTTATRLLLGDGTNPSANNKVAMYSDLTTGTSINANFATLGLGGSAGANALSVTAGNGSTQGSALFNNNAGQFTFALNRNTGSYNAACAFQTNYTTQAQFGLLGNNNLSFQVGSGFTTGLVLDNTTAIPSFPTAPKFNAVNNATQSLTASAWNTVSFQTANFNVGTAYSNSTYKFTAPIAGYYQFIATVNYTGISSGQAVLLTFAKNGTALTSPTVSCQSGVTILSDECGVTTSCVLQLAANDYVTVQTYPSSGTSASTVSGYCSFGGFIVP